MLGRLFRNSIVSECVVLQICRNILHKAHEKLHSFVIVVQSSEYENGVAMHEHSAFLSETAEPLPSGQMALPSTRICEFSTWGIAEICWKPCDLHSKMQNPPSREWREYFQNPVAVFLRSG